MTNMAKYFILVLILMLAKTTVEHLHRPWKWSIIRLDDMKTIKELITTGTPTFELTNCDLVKAVDFACKTRQLGGPYDFWILPYIASYWCPKSNPGKPECHYPGYNYCGYWGCETVATAWKPKVLDNYITVQWAPEGCKRPPYGWDLHNLAARVPTTCKNLLLRIKRPEDSGWITGRTWGVRLYVPTKHPGSEIKIIKQSITVATNSRKIGPNMEIREKLNKGQSSISTPKRQNETKTFYETDDSLLHLVETSYRALNQTEPNMTDSCWLCYDVQPPFYEGVGLNATFTLSKENIPAQCHWHEKELGLTMSQVSGSGTCIGNVPPDQSNLCSLQIANLHQSGHKWNIPSTGGWWACSKTGLKHCVEISVMNENNEFCVQVTVIPRMFYHPTQSFLEHWETGKHKIRKREAITLTIAMLLGLGATGAATGITSLVRQDKGLADLRAAVDEDLTRIAQSISYLEKSLNSLSEVVLQNRRGLDLLYLQQGGLCVALGEECCFYANHSGIIRDSMAELRNGLEQRKKERESQQNWFESWHNQFSWLTPLLTTLAGPLITLLAALTFGPCILNKVTKFVRERIENIQLLTIKQNYEIMSDNPQNEKQTNNMQLNTAKPYCEDMESGIKTEQSSLFRAAEDAVKRFDEQIYDKMKRGEL